MSGSRCASCSKAARRFLRPSLREMVRKVITLGGFLGRKCDGEPETQSMWVGLMRVADFAICWQRFGKDPGSVS